LAAVDGSPSDGQVPPGGHSAGGICPVIVGPTAVGKTGLVTALAEIFPIEVISLDSRQIYHGLRIGTAQPTAAEQATCQHHLIDFLSPDDTYDAMRFRRDFETVYREIAGRGGVALLAGGAGMYLTALREGFMEIPGNSEDSLAAARAALDPLSDGDIRKRLETVDPVSFAEIHPNDRYRSQRALEIHLMSGRPMSRLKAEQRPDPALGLEFPTFVLERPVPELDARIAARTEQMLDEGWIEETRTALEKHAPDCPGLLSIGYREIVNHLQGSLAREDLAPEIIKVTRQYAKRQRTWFRQTAAAGRGGPGDPELVEALGKMVELARQHHQ
jgi:tRNA dimethylallyltransferase